MTTPSETDKSLTTAQALGLFARELATYDEISPHVADELVMTAGRAILADDALAVKRDV